MKSHILKLILAGSLGLATLYGCGAPKGATQVQGRSIGIFLDQSDSIKNDTQKALWLTIARNLIAGLSYGDHIMVFGIHDRTGDAAPLFAGEIPALSPDPGVDELTSAKRTLQEARKKALATIESAVVEPVRSRETDVFSAFNRLPVNGDSRPSIRVIFSDGLQATKQCNFERMCLKENEIPELIRTAAGQHGWNNNTLKGARVYVILPSARIGQARICNDIRVLRGFYEILIKTLGGSLVSFDTHLQGGQL